MNIHSDTITETMIGRCSHLSALGYLLSGMGSTGLTRHSESRPLSVPARLLKQTTSPTQMWEGSGSCEWLTAHHGVLYDVGSNRKQPGVLSLEAGTPGC